MKLSFKYPELSSVITKWCEDGAYACPFLRDFYEDKEDALLDVGDNFLRALSGKDMHLAVTAPVEKLKEFLAEIEIDEEDMPYVINSAIITRAVSIFTGDKSSFLYIDRFDLGVNGPALNCEIKVSGDAAKAFFLRQAEEIAKVADELGRVAPDEETKKG